MACCPPWRFLSSSHKTTTKIKQSSFVSLLFPFFFPFPISLFPICIRSTSRKRSLIIMPSTIVKFFVAALAAGVATALPQPQAAASAAPAAPAANANDALIADLKDAPTAVDRFKKLLTGADGKLLKGDDLNKKVVFDFNNPTATSDGGRVSAANIKNFPILTDLGISTTVAFLGACGINTPHIHPRATEFLTVVSGNVDFG